MLFLNPIEGFIPFSISSSHAENSSASIFLSIFSSVACISFSISGPASPDMYLCKILDILNTATFLFGVDSELNKLSIDSLLLPSFIYASYALAISSLCVSKKLFNLYDRVGISSTVSLSRVSIINSAKEMSLSLRRVPSLSFVTYGTVPFPVSDKNICFIP